MTPEHANFLIEFTNGLSTCHLLKNSFDDVQEGRVFEITSGVYLQHKTSVIKLDIVDILKPKSTQYFYYN